jgi:hypothetical protein
MIPVRFYLCYNKNSPNDKYDFPAKTAGLPDRLHVETTMRRFLILTLSCLFILASCSQRASTGTPGLTPASRCGDAICAGNENAITCPQDCPAATFSGRIKTTIISSEGSDIAVMVASPQVPRYPEGAGIIVVASPIFTPANGFITIPDLTSLGLIQVSYLWPGETDARTGAKSTGAFDYGGEHSVNILRDVLRFAANRIPDKNGHYFVSMTSVPPLVAEVGVYAFADAGIDAVRTFSLYGSQFQGLQYFIAREVPTLDTLSAMETGYFDDAGQPVYNPFYVYPTNFSFAALTLNYTNLRWDPTYTSSYSKAVGRPYLDLDGTGKISPGDFIFDGQIPVMFGKRYYSTALTQALLDNGALTPATWPADLATPQEAAQAWQIRQTSGLFETMQDDDIIQNMKVMLVFAQIDHAQVAQDKPHIHQLYQGFRFEARLWVRLNPDRSYVESLVQINGAGSPGTPGNTPTPGPNLAFPDNPANTQPDAYPGEGQAGSLVPLSAAAEMADRAHSGDWDENLGAVLYTFPAATPQP